MERIREALTALTPESRALLELSLRRGVSDEDIAKLLNVELAAVDKRRQAAIDVLSEQLGLSAREDTDELRATLPDMPDELWLPPANGKGPAPAPATEPEPDDRAERERRVAQAVAAAEETGADTGGTRGATWALLGVLVVVAAGAVVALSTGGDSNEGDSKPAPKPAPAKGGPARLAPLPGESGGGTATVSGGRLRLKVTGLPAPGAGSFYEAWLYNSLADARPLGRLKEGALNARLPAGGRGYKYVDVSLEPGDGNPSHSGASAVRVPLAKLGG